MAEFIPGLHLCELFYREAVRPLVLSTYPGLRHSAGLIGTGSEVLGFDSRRSTDHCWGPRLQLFLDESDHAHIATKIDRLLRTRLPAMFRGHSTHFVDTGEQGTWVMAPGTTGKISHRVELTTVKRFFTEYLGIDPAKPLSLKGWLLLSEQKLATVRNGKVFHDDLGLNAIRGRLEYYPRDVWLFCLASQWRRLSQEEPFVGRCGEAGDDLGSRIIAARLIRDMMRLCFLMERRYAPYGKWLGTAFAGLKCVGCLHPIFLATLSAGNWKLREQHLCRAYEALARMHNRLKVTRPLATSVSRFFGRPYRVIRADRFADAIGKLIKDPSLSRMTHRAGSVNQWIDCTDVMCPELLGKAGHLYR